MNQVNCEMRSWHDFLLGNGRITSMHLNALKDTFGFLRVYIPFQRSGSPEMKAIIKLWYFMLVIFSKLSQLTSFVF